MIKPRVVGVQARLPAHPVLSRLLGEQVLLLEPHRFGKLCGTSADQHDMVGIVHHRLGHQRRRSDPFDGGHRARPAGWTVHARGVELNHALFVRQAAQPHRLIRRIELHQVHAGDRRVERVFPREHLVVGDLYALYAVRGRHHEGTPTETLNRGGESERLAYFVPEGIRKTRNEAGSGERGGALKEIATGQWHGGGSGTGSANGVVSRMIGF